jgi:hypothetical protein
LALEQFACVYARLSAPVQARIDAGEEVDDTALMVGLSHFYDWFVGTAELHEHGKAVRDYAIAAYCLAAHLRLYSSGTAFEAEHLKQTLSLAATWKITEDVQAALGLTTLSIEQWMSAVGSPQSQPEKKLPVPVWHQLFKMSHEAKLHAPQWYADNHLIDLVRRA